MIGKRDSSIGENIATQALGCRAGAAENTANRSQVAAQDAFIGTRCSQRNGRSVAAIVQPHIAGIFPQRFTARGCDCVDRNIPARRADIYGCSITARCQIVGRTRCGDVIQRDARSTCDGNRARGCARIGISRCCNVGARAGRHSTRC